jgi:hypothetical protein
MTRLPVFLMALLFSLVFNAGFAAAKKIPAKILADSTKLVVKKFDAKALERLKADKAYNYNGQSTGEESLWDVFWNWVWYHIGQIFKAIPFSGTVFKYLLIAACVALFVFVIAKSLGIDPIQMIRGGARKVEVPYTESLENIHDINFDEEIEKAIALHNYRLAVRLLYLKCLKQLSDNHLIHWQIDKTNTAYIYELKDANQRQTFSSLTRQFEFVWYGNFAIDQQTFSNINLLFQDFKKQTL